MIVSALITFIPLLAKLGTYFLGKYIAKDAASAEKAKMLNKQWLDTLHNIAVGLQESVEIGDKYADAKARLDAKFDAMKQGEK